MLVKVGDVGQASPDNSGQNLDMRLNAARRRAPGAIKNLADIIKAASRPFPTLAAGWGFVRHEGCPL